MNLFFLARRIAPWVILLGCSSAHATAMPPQSAIRSASVEYECLPAIKIDSVPRRLALGQELEAALDWNSVENHIRTIRGGRLRFLQSSVGGPSMLGDLSLMFGDRTLGIDVRALTVEQNFLHLMTVRAPEHPTLKVVLRVNPSYQIFVDRFGKHGDTPEAEAFYLMREMGFSEENAKKHLQTPAGQVLISEMAVREKSTVKTWSEFAQIVPRDYDYFNLLRMGAIIFTNDKAAIILARDYQSLALCGPVSGENALPDSRALLGELFKFLGSREVRGFLSCEGLLLN